MSIVNKTFKKIQRIFGDIADFKEFIDGYFNPAIDDINYNFKNISFSGNFNGEILENIVISSGSTVTLSHKLGIVPKYRIILKQEGNGLITDGEFNQNTVSLINNGSSSVTLTIGLFKE